MKRLLRIEDPTHRLDLSVTVGILIACLCYHLVPRAWHDGLWVFLVAVGATLVVLGLLVALGVGLYILYGAYRGVVYTITRAIGFADNRIGSAGSGRPAAETAITPAAPPFGRGDEVSPSC
jgi:hypothetical protein